MHDNPYSAPLEVGMRGRPRASSLPLRVVFYAHLGLLVVFTVVALLKTGILMLPGGLGTALMEVGPFVVGAVFLCPVAMVFAAAWGRCNWSVCITVMLAEVVLVFVQFVVISAVGLW